jgi:hypothetical protein
MNIKTFSKFNEELTGKYKEETEIIYKDKDLVCMLPKSQMTSSIYGKGANWCQTQVAGFDMWSGKNRNEKALLIRFLIRGGRKIRFTYFPNKEFYWANESGWHVLKGEGNPFEANPFKDNNIRDVEKDILDLIKDKIPQECKDKVLEFIEKNLKDYKYIYRNQNYIPQHLEKLRDAYTEVKRKYDEVINKINSEGNIYISSYFHNNKITLQYSPGPSKMLEELFDNADDFEKKLKQLIDENKKV